MKQIRLATVSAVALMSTLSLSGCAWLYPNWGATGLPTETPAPSQTSIMTITPTVPPMPTPTIIVKKPAVVQVTMQNVDATAGTVGVVAQIANVAEDGGFCTLKLVSGASAKTITVKAESNVNTTQCYPMEVSIANFPKGNATLTVGYDSMNYAGASAPIVVNIP